jgi:ligand-binding SRPBCC domain-containing protein
MGCPAVSGWRSLIGGDELAETSWRSGVAEWGGGVGWRSHHSADSTQDACLFVDEISVGLKLALSEWRSRLAEQVGGAGWRTRLADQVGGPGWRSRAGGVGLAESDWRSHHSAHDTQDACVVVDEISVGLKLALSEWRSTLAEHVGGARWRCRLAEQAGGAGWRSGLAESD